MFLKSKTKLTIQQKYTPTTTFLSPVQKYNQRSFSASSLQPSNSRETFSGSLRDQIRLDSFKKSILTDSKLNKTAISKANLKISNQQCLRKQQMRSQNRDLVNEVVRLRQQNIKLNAQHSQTMLLISRQKQLISSLEQQLILIKSLPVKANPCQCYHVNEYMNKIQNLQVKIRHLQEQKKQFKEQIRNLIVKQEQLKFQLNRYSQKLGKQVKHSRKLQDILYAQERKPKQQRGKQESISNSRSMANTSPKGQDVYKSIVENGEVNRKQSDLRRYYDYLKNIRNRQIDQIQNILNQ